MPYLEMKGITKRYPNDVLANDSVDLSVERNEIHAIVGENGAGKSTLMKILHGLERPDEGSIYFKGQEVSFRTPLDANRLGIGMVHQHFQLVPEFTVAENVVLGIEPRRRGVLVDTALSRKRIRALVASYGFGVEPETRVSNLTVGQMQQVEIIKMLYREAELLVLDEPTSVLTEQEINRLFETLRGMQRDGKTSIIITHKLHEVKRISDRVTVMRKGRVVAVRKTDEVEEVDLARLMIGKDILFRLERDNRACGDVMLELKNVTLKLRGHTQALLDDVSLKVRSCEIVGVAGVGGNGLGELEDVATGLRRINSGQILYDGEDISRMSPARIRERGLAYVPADRLRRGSSSESSVQENMIVSRHHAFLRSGFLRGGAIHRFAQDLTRDFSIDGDPAVPIGTLSGGNIQKVILARELATEAGLIVFSEPTWGLDVGSSQFVYEKVLEMRARGAAILLISSNLDEILRLSDTVAVMYRGRIVSIQSNEHTISKEVIGEYMLGLRDDFRPVNSAEEGRT